MKKPTAKIPKLLRQKGVIFLALMLVLIVTGSTVAISALNNRQSALLERNREVRYQMEQAKAALLAYAANYASFYSDRGPGFFPCPDTSTPAADPDGTPNYTGTASLEQCSYDTPALGRLPQMEIFDNTTFRFNDTYADVDQQFWYVAAPRYLYSNTLVKRRSYYRTYADSATSTAASSYWLTLDGEAKYVALIIAPGEELEDQNRTAGPANYANYLDGQNGGDGFNFYTSYSSNPELFNDEVIGITLDEYMIYVGAAVAREVKLRFDQYYALNLNAYSPTRYPASGAAVVPDTSLNTCTTSNASNVFDGTTYGAANLWIRDSTSGNLGERWSCRQNMNWTRDAGSANYGKGYLAFAGCPNIKFRIEYANSVLTRDGDTCL